MLILTREENESIIISTTDGKVEVTIAHVSSSGKVQLSITAPKCVIVHRKEIQLIVEKEQAEIEAGRSRHGVKFNLPSKTH